MAPLIVVILLSYLFLKDPIRDLIQQKELWRARQLKRYVYLPLLIILPILMVNTLLPSKQRLTPHDTIAYGKTFHFPHLVTKGYRQLIATDSTDIDLHFSYVESLIDLPGTLENTMFLRRYFDMTYSKDRRVAEIGNLCSSAFYAYKKDYETARLYLNKVRTTTKYANYLHGYINYYTGATAKAVPFFEREIEQNGYRIGAYKLLCDALYYTHRKEDLVALVDNPSAAEYLPSWLKMRVYFHRLDVFHYGKEVLLAFFKRMNVWGVLAAFLVSVMWLLYLRKLDIYEPEKWITTIAVFTMGLLFTFGVFPLSDVLNYHFDFSLNGNVINDFFYCVIGIGAVEELVKILPLLLILRFSKHVNEPYDYIYYASVSALGFAFTENIKYYEEGRMYIVHSRTLVAVVGHMVDTSVFAYGLMLNRYRYKLPWFFNFLLFWALASLMHGFYDYWLINDWASQYSYLTYFFFLASIHIWVILKNNSLNHSENLDYNVELDNHAIRQYLVFGVTTICMLQYMLISWQYSDYYANTFLLESGSFTLYLLVYLSLNLSQFKVVKGHWGRLKLPKLLFIPRLPVPENLDGLTLRLTPHKKSGAIRLILPLTVSVVERKVVRGNVSWYLVKSKVPFTLNGEQKHYLLLFNATPRRSLVFGEQAQLAVMDLKTSEQLNLPEYKKGEARWLGYATGQKQENE